jgi:hypothetical protein
MKFFKMFMLLTFSYCLLHVEFAKGSEQATKDQMSADLDCIKNTFEIYYAPKEWKKSYANWDLETEIQRTKDKIQSSKNITMKKYQTFVKEFFQSTKDYHTGVHFYSTEEAALPFSVRGADGRYFITYVYNTLLPSDVPLEVGDELLSFDGKPADLAIKEIMEQDSTHSNKDTDAELAALLLTNRMGAAGQYVPQGTIAIEVQSKRGQRTKKYNLEWIYFPERIFNGFNAKFMTASKTEKTPNLQKFDRKMQLPLYDILSKRKIKMAGSEEESFLGSRKSFIPPLSNKILWKSSNSNPFYAYLYVLPNQQKIGYVRIPEYYCTNENVEAFAKIIAYFEANSDALVIDQVDNPGGFVAYMFQLLSLLSKDPLHLPTQRMMITPEDVDSAIHTIDIIDFLRDHPEFEDGYLEDFEDLPKDEEQRACYFDYFNFIVGEWTAGRYFTDPYYLYGLADLKPPLDETPYTKPILVLVNDLDFSCGDFFPAVLQDNKRATIFGARTAGAGGYVLSAAFPNRFGIKDFHYTASIAERLNKQPIENLGITPDVEYPVTEKDLQNNYSGYVKAVNEAVTTLLIGK